MKLFLHYLLRFRDLLFFATGLVCTSVASGPVVAAVPVAGVRYVIEAVSGGDTHSGTGFFVFCPWAAAGAKPVITVARKSGAPVAQQILWAAAGEPAKVLFDCSSGDATYTVTEGGAVPAGGGDWQPTAGLVLETRAWRDGPVGNWREIRKTCEESAPVLGRSLMPNIFLGVHPHGPNGPCVSIFRGWLRIDRPGVYNFAVASEDAASFFVDGRHVVSWPGVHGINGPGRRGKFNADVELPAGVHAVEYLNVVQDSGYSVVLAWKAPGQKRLDVVPAAAFVQPSQFRVVRSEPAAGPDAAVRFAWDIQRHLSFWGHSVVFVELRALCDAAEYRWVFDDGTTLRGREVSHWFLSSGMRRVKLVVAIGQGKRETVHDISVHPLWRQLAETDRDYWGRFRKELLTRDFSQAPPADLLNMLRISSKMEDHVLAKALAGICLRRLGEWGGDASAVAMEVGCYCQSLEVRDYGMAQQAFDAVLRLPDTASPLKAGAQLAMAVSLLPVSNDFARVRQLLAGLDGSRLSAEEKRLKTICEGDLLFATGQPAAARVRYLEAGTRSRQAKESNGLRWQARLETARDYNRRGEFDAAERLVATMQEEASVERLNEEMGLIVLDACLGRGDFTRAYFLGCRMLQNTASDSRRPVLLYLVAESAFQVKADAEAAAAVGKLLGEYPYSEPAARAREKWGGRRLEKKR